MANRLRVGLSLEDYYKMSVKETELKKIERDANRNRGVVIFEMYDDDDDEYVIVPDGDGIVLKKKSEIKEEE